MAGIRVQERVVVLLATVLAGATTLASLSVVFLAPPHRAVWHSFDLSVALEGNPGVGSPLTVNVSLRRGLVDPASLWIAFVSLDVGDLQIVSGTPADNPWGYPTTWNITGLDLSVTHSFLVDLVPADSGLHPVHAMVWTPQGDLASVHIEANGYVNPAGASLLEVTSLSIDVP